MEQRISNENTNSIFGILQKSLPSFIRIAIENLNSSVRNHGFSYLGVIVLGIVGAATTDLLSSVLSKRYGSYDKSKKRNEFLQAACDGDIDKLVNFISKGQDLTCADKNGSNALMLAAWAGRREAVLILLHSGADVNDVSHHGWTALTYAARAGEASTVETLLEWGAEVNIVENTTGATPLMFAAFVGSLECVELLLDYGADPLIRTKQGALAFAFAEENGHEGIAGMLRHRAADAQAESQAMKEQDEARAARQKAKQAMLLRKKQEQAYIQRVEEQRRKAAIEKAQYLSSFHGQLEILSVGCYLTLDPATVEEIVNVLMQSRWDQSLVKPKMRRLRVPSTNGVGEFELLHKELLRHRALNALSRPMLNESKDNDESSSEEDDEDEQDLENENSPISNSSSQEESFKQQPPIRLLGLLDLVQTTFEKYTIQEEEEEEEEEEDSFPDETENILLKNAANAVTFGNSSLANITMDRINLLHAIRILDGLGGMAKSYIKNLRPNKKFTSSGARTHMPYFLQVEPQIFGPLAETLTSIIKFSLSEPEFPHQLIRSALCSLLFVIQAHLNTIGILRLETTRSQDALAVLGDALLYVTFTMQTFEENDRKFSTTKLRASTAENAFSINDDDAIITSKGRKRNFNKKGRRLSHKVLQSNERSLYNNEDHQEDEVFEDEIASSTNMSMDNKNGEKLNENMNENNAGQHHHMEKDGEDGEYLLPGALAAKVLTQNLRVITRSTESQNSFLSKLWRRSRGVSKIVLRKYTAEALMEEKAISYLVCQENDSPRPFGDVPSSKRRLANVLGVDINENSDKMEKQYMIDTNQPHGRRASNGSCELNSSPRYRTLSRNLSGFDEADIQPNNNNNNGGGGNLRRQRLSSLSRRDSIQNRVRVRSVLGESNQNRTTSGMLKRRSQALATIQRAARSFVHSSGGASSSTPNLNRMSSANASNMQQIPIPDSPQSRHSKANGSYFSEYYFEENNEKPSLSLEQVEELILSDEEISVGKGKIPEQVQDWIQDSRNTIITELCNPKKLSKSSSSSSTLQQQQQQQSDPSPPLTKSLEQISKLVPEELSLLSNNYNNNKRKREKYSTHQKGEDESNFMFDLFLRAVVENEDVNSAVLLRCIQDDLISRLLIVLQHRKRMGLSNSINPSSVEEVLLNHCQTLFSKCIENFLRKKEKNKFSYKKTESRFLVEDIACELMDRLAILQDWNKGAEFLYPILLELIQGANTPIYMKTCATRLLCSFAKSKIKTVDENVSDPSIERLLLGPLFAYPSSAAASTSSAGLDEATEVFLQDLARSPAQPVHLSQAQALHAKITSSPLLRMLTAQVKGKPNVLEDVVRIAAAAYLKHTGTASLAYNRAYSIANKNGNNNSNNQETDRILQIIWKTAWETTRTVISVYRQNQMYICNVTGCKHPVVEDNDGWRCENGHKSDSYDVEEGQTYQEICATVAARARVLLNLGAANNSIHQQQKLQDIDAILRHAKRFIESSASDGIKEDKLELYLKTKSRHSFNREHGLKIILDVLTAAFKLKFSNSHDFDELDGNNNASQRLVTIKSAANIAATYMRTGSLRSGRQSFDGGNIATSGVTDTHLEPVLTAVKEVYQSMQRPPHVTGYHSLDFQMPSSSAMQIQTLSLDILDKLLKIAEHSISSGEVALVFQVLQIISIKACDHDILVKLKLVPRIVRLIDAGLESGDEYLIGASWSYFSRICMQVMYSSWLEMRFMVGMKLENTIEAFSNEYEDEEDDSDDDEESDYEESEDGSSSVGTKDTGDESVSNTGKFDHPHEEFDHVNDGGGDDHDEDEDDQLDIDYDKLQKIVVITIRNQLLRYSKKMDDTSDPIYENAELQCYRYLCLLGSLCARKRTTRNFASLLYQDNRQHLLVSLITCPSPRIQQVAIRLGRRILGYCRPKHIVGKLFRVAGEWSLSLKGHTAAGRSHDLAMECAGMLRYLAGKHQKRWRAAVISESEKATVKYLKSGYNCSPSVLFRFWTTLAILDMSAQSTLRPGCRVKVFPTSGFSGWNESTTKNQEYGIIIQTARRNVTSSSDQVFHSEEGSKNCMLILDSHPTKIPTKLDAEKVIPITIVLEEYKEFFHSLRNCGWLVDVIDQFTENFWNSSLQHDIAWSEFKTMTMSVLHAWLSTDASFAIKQIASSRPRVWRNIVAICACPAPTSSLENVDDLQSTSQAFSDLKLVLCELGVSPLDSMLHRQLRYPHTASRVRSKTFSNDNSNSLDKIEFQNDITSEEEEQHSSLLTAPVLQRDKRAALARQASTQMFPKRVLQQVNNKSEINSTLSNKEEEEEDDDDESDKPLGSSVLIHQRSTGNLMRRNSTSSITRLDGRRNSGSIGNVTIGSRTSSSSNPHQQQQQQPKKSVKFESSTSKTEIVLQTPFREMDREEHSFYTFELHVERNRRRARMERKRRAARRLRSLSSSHSAHALQQRIVLDDSGKRFANGGIGGGSDLRIQSEQPPAPILCQPDTPRGRDAATLSLPVELPTVDTMLSVPVSTSTSSSNNNKFGKKNHQQEGGNNSRAVVKEGTLLRISQDEIGVVEQVQLALNGNEVAFIHVFNSVTGFQNCSWKDIADLELSEDIISDRYRLFQKSKRYHNNNEDGEDVVEKSDLDDGNNEEQAKQKIGKEIRDLCSRSAILNARRGAVAAISGSIGSTESEQMQLLVGEAGGASQIIGMLKLCESTSSSSDLDAKQQNSVSSKLSGLWQAVGVLFDTNDDFADMLLDEAILYLSVTAKDTLFFETPHPLCPMDEFMNQDVEEDELSYNNSDCGSNSNSNPSIASPFHQISSMLAAASGSAQNAFSDTSGEEAEFHLELDLGNNNENSIMNGIEDVENHQDNNDEDDDELELARIEHNVSPLPPPPPRFYSTNSPIPSIGSSSMDGHPGSAVHRDYTFKSRKLSGSHRFSIRGASGLLVEFDRRSSIISSATQVTLSYDPQDREVIKVLGEGGVDAWQPVVVSGDTCYIHWNVNQYDILKAMQRMDELNVDVDEVAWGVAVRVRSLEELANVDEMQVLEKPFGWRLMQIVAGNPSRVLARMKCGIPFFDTAVNYLRTNHLAFKPELCEVLTLLVKARMEERRKSISMIDTYEEWDSVMQQGLYKLHHDLLVLFDEVAEDGFTSVSPYFVCLLELLVLCRTLWALPPKQLDSNKKAPLCSLVVFGRRENSKVVVDCETCQLNAERGICLACAATCHKGHKFANERSTTAPCGCSIRGPEFCKALRPFGDVWKIAPTDRTWFDVVCQTADVIDCISTSSRPIPPGFMRESYRTCEDGKLLRLCLRSLEECLRSEVQDVWWDREARHMWANMLDQGMDSIAEVAFGLKVLVSSLLPSAFVFWWDERKGDWMNRIHTNQAWSLAQAMLQLSYALAPSACYTEWDSRLQNWTTTLEGIAGLGGEKSCTFLLTGEFPRPQVYLKCITCGLEICEHCAEFKHRVNGHKLSEETYGPGFCDERTTSMNSAKPFFEMFQSFSVPNFDCLHELYWMNHDTDDVSDEQVPTEPRTLAALLNIPHNVFQELMPEEPTNDVKKKPRNKKERKQMRKQQNGHSQTLVTCVPREFSNLLSPSLQGILIELLGVKEDCDFLCVSCDADHGFSLAIGAVLTNGARNHGGKAKVHGLVNNQSSRLRVLKNMVSLRNDFGVPVGPIEVFQGDLLAHARAISEFGKEGDDGKKNFGNKLSKMKQQEEKKIEGKTSDLSMQEIEKDTVCEINGLLPRYHRIFCNGVCTLQQLDALSSMLPIDGALLCPMVDSLGYGIYVQRNQFTGECENRTLAPLYDDSEHFLDEISKMRPILSNYWVDDDTSKSKHKEMEPEEKEQVETETQKILQLAENQNKRCEKICEIWDLDKWISLANFANHFAGRETASLGFRDINKKSIDAFPLLQTEEIEILRGRFAILKRVNDSLSEVLPLINLTPQYSAGGIGKQLSKFNTKRLIFLSTKLEAWSKVLEPTWSDAPPSTMPAITVSRKIAEEGLTLEDTLFMQTYNQVQNFPLCALRRRDQSFKVRFAGEGGHDVGGLYRDLFTEICAEIREGRPPLLFHPPLVSNNSTDALLPRPSLVSQLDLRLFEFLGSLVGIACMRHGITLALDISPLVWKVLVKDQLMENDLRYVDEVALQTVSFIQRALEDEFDQVFQDAVFAIAPSDANSPIPNSNTNNNNNNGSLLDDVENNGSSNEHHEILLPSMDIHNNNNANSSSTNNDDENKKNVYIELCPLGKERKVTSGNALEYAKLLIQFRLNEFKLQIDSMKRGIVPLVPARLLPMFTWQELENLVCGVADVDVEFLHSRTKYVGGVRITDPHIKFFWDVLSNEFTPSDRTQFLRFVWGRERMSTAEEGSTFVIGPHLRARDSKDPDKWLPVAHTCFFSLDLPAYSSREITKSRLLFAMNNCNAIDADDTGEGLANMAISLDQ